jgi:hypothetical protein
MTEVTIEMWENLRAFVIDAAYSPYDGLFGDKKMLEGAVYLAERVLEQMNQLEKDPEYCYKRFININGAI